MAVETNSIVEGLKKQEAEMEKAITGNPVEPTATPVEPVVEPVVEAIDIPISVPVVETVVETEPKKPRTNWKKRFTNYKSATDPKLNEQRQHITQLESEHLVLVDRLNQLEAQVKTSAVPVDPFEGTFTPEQAEAFGAEGLEVVKTAATTAAQAESAPLKKQLEDERKLRKEAEEKRVHQEAQVTYDKFLAMLANKVPDYGTLNTDPKFAEWMSYQDPDSIYSRRFLFESAEKNRDAGAVARYMLEYKKAIGAIPNNPTIDKHITPTAVAGAESHTETNTVKPMSMAWIKDFTNDVARGKYKAMPGEAKKLQEQIDHHLNSGGPLVP